MQRLTLRAVLSMAAALVVCCSLSAATVQQLNLQQMCDRADKIFRGTVLDVREGTVHAGGIDLPTVTYRLRVDDALKGSFLQVKGLQIAEIKMIGKLKASDSAPLRSFSPLPELPKLVVGQEYLLLTTRPSSAGLSATIGLAQGAFGLNGKPGQEMAVNGNENRGLFLGMPGPTGLVARPPGPLPYTTLAGMIRTIVGP
ncbi:MAG TPA: hypothetical protein VF173_30755 [Thermoanaerobaculia bacterium]|nr:hypothetical protein [Thermoanaerobaculia bacterium]